MAARPGVALQDDPGDLCDLDPDDSDDWSQEQMAKGS